MRADADHAGEVMKVMEKAAAGSGMACLEEAVLAGGRAQLRTMMQQAMRAHTCTKEGVRVKTFGSPG